MLLVVFTCMRTKARVEFLRQELTHVVIATVEAEVRSSSVSVCSVDGTFAHGI